MSVGKVGSSSLMLAQCQNDFGTGLTVGHETTLKISAHTDTDTHTQIVKGSGDVGKASAIVYLGYRTGQAARSAKRTSESMEQSRVGTEKRNDEKEGE